VIASVEAVKGEFEGGDNGTLALLD